MAAPQSTATRAESEPALSVQDLRARVDAGRIDSVIMGFPGLYGLRGKSFDAHFFLDHVFERGAGTSAYLLTADPDMRFLPGFALVGWETGAGDVLLRPDPATLRPAGWTTDSAFVLADALDVRQQPIALAPRAVLADQVRRLERDGVSASLGLEAEALAYEITDRAARRRGYRDLSAAGDVNGDYALEHPGPFTGLLAALRRAARDTGLPLEAVKTEAGLGQLEITFRHADPLAAADAHTVYKLLARTVAQQERMSLTFMAKPYTALDGNSCHLHLSLNTVDGTGLVDQDGHLTAFGEHAVAGALAALGDLAVLMLPYVNSYKRLHTDPPLFAPSTLTWGYDNRTTAIRVVGHGTGGHLECRIPGADAQPHLAAAALLAACGHGIRQQLPLKAEPVAGNAYQHPGAPLLPQTLDQAVSRFAGSVLAGELFGAPVVEHYTTAARHESAYHRGAVSDVERERGFARA
jgi:glutamine synthetase